MAAAICAAPGPLHGERAPRSTQVAVWVEEVPSDDAWTVGYALDRPAAAVEFVAGGKPFRRELWSVAARSGDAEWRDDGGRDRLCFSRPVGAFSVGFRTLTQPLDGSSALHVAFSEGSRLLATRELLVRPLSSCRGPDPAATEVEHRFAFRSAPGRGIRLLDRAGTGELSWHPAPGTAAADTYVYFGEVPAAETEHAAVVLDPGLPKELAAGMAAGVPRLVARFTAETATPLPGPPFVLVAWGGSGGTGRAFRVATSPGVLVATVEGGGWRTGGELDGGGWHDRFARELFGLWNREAYPPEPGAEWLAEAAAERFADTAAVAFGVRSEPEARRRLVARANDCLVRLQAKSVVAAVAGGDQRAGASCGAVALAAADGALRRAAPASDLGKLFRRLFEHAAATGSYGTAAFLGGVRELRADTESQALLHQLLRSGVPTRTDRLVQRLLEQAEIETVPADPTGAATEEETLRELVRRAIGRCWCGAGEQTACDPAETGRGVASVDGEPVDTAPLAAWEHLRRAVSGGGVLAVVLDGEEVSLFCSSDSFDPTWDTLLALPRAPE